MSRLLILGCSGRKFRTPSVLPAWYRYDGMLFRVCKRLEATGRFPAEVQILILSAEFGLIRRDALIPWYERELDAARAAALRPEVTRELHRAVRQDAAKEIYLALGATYRAAVGPLPPGLTVIDVREPIGRRMERLAAWLTPPDAQMRIGFGETPG